MIGLRSYLYRILCHSVVLLRLLLLLLTLHIASSLGVGVTLVVSALCLVRLGESALLSVFLVHFHALEPDVSEVNRVTIVKLLFAICHGRVPLLIKVLLVGN